MNHDERLEQNKAIVMRFVEEAWNKGDMAVADEILASNYIRHGENFPEGILRGLEAMKKYIVNSRTAWPDFHLTALNVVAQGDKVVVRWKCTGTFKGQVEGWPAPNGKQMVFEALVLYRIVGGKIVEDWFFNQNISAFSQMGLKLVPAQAEAGK
jgi:predicted ester cyclase